MEAMLFRAIQTAIAARNLPINVAYENGDGSTDDEISFSDEDGHPYPIGVQVGQGYCGINEYGYDDAKELESSCILSIDPFHRIANVRQWAEGVVDLVSRSEPIR